MITIKAKKITSIREKCVGLLKNKAPEIIFLKTRFGIHTFFLKFSIDVIILDKNYKVRVLKNSLNPNKIFLWNPKFNNVIELPSGTIEKMQIKLGSIVEIKETIH